MRKFKAYEAFRKVKNKVAAKSRAINRRRAIRLSKASNSLKKGGDEICMK